MPDMSSASASKGHIKVGRAKRASRPKVKTGCNNCKLRRVKCDETRPSCLKCEKSGRHCDGYPAYKRTVEVAIPIAPRPPDVASSSASYPALPNVTLNIARKQSARAIQQLRPTPPPTPILQNATVLSPTLYRPSGYAFNEREGQYFQIFRTRTASELSGFFDSDFWTRSVLQESHSEASIRHAVVALGALYKTLDNLTESPPGSPDSDVNANANIGSAKDSAPNHYSFALQQYGESITRLRESLESNERRSKRTILMSIVLYTCFQSFTGDHRAAITQIQSGLGLLEERRRKNEQQSRLHHGDAVENELVQMFTRLAVQAKSYDMAFHFPHPYVIRLTPRITEDPTSPQSPPSDSEAFSSSSVESHIPEIFTALEDARAALDSLTERVLRFNEQLSSFNPGPNNILPAHLRSRVAGFKTQLQQWGGAFAPLLEARHNRGVTLTERASINVVKMMHITCSILFVTAFSLTEMEFDNFVPQFKECVELAKEVVVDEELSLASLRCGNINSCRHRQDRPSRSSGAEYLGTTSHRLTGVDEEDSYSHIKASFALDLGIVPPLFVVGTKCRDRRLRREAIRLLMASPRREGMWDSILCGKVSQWIMDVEEEGMRNFEIWDPMAMNEQIGEQKRVMVKEILFDLQRREAIIRCGTRGTHEGQQDWKSQETNISW